MGGTESRSELVEVARVGTLMDADVIRAALDSAGIPAMVPGANTSNTLSHMAGGLNTKGFRVLVSLAAAEDAKSILDELGKRQAAAPKSKPTADDWARASWRAAVLAILVPLFIPVTLYNISRAKREARKAAPADMPRYARSLRRARLLVWGMIIMYIVLFGSLCLTGSGALPSVSIPLEGR